ncbi:MAG: hypothetical protein IJ642_08885 [Oscillospiraceae bacterium]|nr:hypothetical protein [Oscillospiraceae bacterium]
MTRKKQQKLTRKLLRKKQKEILHQKTSVLKKERIKKMMTHILAIMVGIIFLAEPLAELINLFWIFFKIIMKG